MSKASQRRMALADKRIREQGMSPSEVRKVLAMGHLMGRAERTPVEFWSLLGQSQKTDPPHPDDGRITAVLDQTRRWLEVLANNYATNFSDGTTIPGTMPAHLAGAIGGLLIEDAGSPPRRSVTCATVDGRRLTCSDEVFEELESLSAQADKQPHDVAIWVFTFGGPGQPMLCVGRTRSGAMQCHTFVRGTWLKAASVRPVLDYVFGDLDYWEDAVAIEAVSADCVLAELHGSITHAAIARGVEDEVEYVLLDSFDSCRHGYVELSAQLALAVADALDVAVDARAELQKLQEGERRRTKDAVRSAVEQVRQEAASACERLQRQLADAREREAALQRALGEAAGGEQTANQPSSSTVVQRLEAIFHV